MSLRHAARTLVDRAAALTGVLAVCERAMRNGLTILTYHRVLPDARCRGYHLPSLAMPLSVFREQVRYLAEHFRVVTAREGVGILAGDAGDGRAHVSLTFDDGYADNFAIVAPVLAEFDLRATFYVTTGLIGTQARFWFDDAALRWASLGGERLRAELARISGQQLGDESSPSTMSEWLAFLKSLGTKERMRVLDELPAGEKFVPDQLDRIMAPEELKELARRGHEIGSHSVTHPLLPQLSDTELESELALSRQWIASWVVMAPTGFCYPNGDHDERVVRAARSAGYGYACTTRAGRNGPSQDRFRLLRIDMSPHRVTRGGFHDLLAMRGEISLLHERVR